jgi:hypothetical protein
MKACSMSGGTPRSEAGITVWDLENPAFVRVGEDEVVWTRRGWSVRVCRDYSGSAVAGRPLYYATYYVVCHRGARIDTTEAGTTVSYPAFAYVHGPGRRWRAARRVLQTMAELVQACLLEAMERLREESRPGAPREGDAETDPSDPR